MPSKPAKYGVKIWCCCDAYTSYPLRPMGQVYLGRQPDHHVKLVKVQGLISPLRRSGRNIVGDNFFSHWFCWHRQMYLRNADVTCAPVTRTRKWQECTSWGHAANQFVLSTVNCRLSVTTARIRSDATTLVTIVLN